AVSILGLKYAVITSVTRDDLDDGGAQIFYETIMEIKHRNPNCIVEVLIPDFKGNDNAIYKIIEAKPDVINHNIEVVEELFSKMRPQGDYNLSLNLLQKIKEIDSNIITKSGFMIGLGENMDQIIKTMHDLRDRDVDVLTIGQYLQPSIHHAPTIKYYTPDEFKYLKDIGYQIGFLQVESAPLVRSSYHADNIINLIKRGTPSTES
ncbi:MAG TPA: lipoyl synthase, partial [Thermoplasmatales archaeon]|nr:lipoyl synthase [Thermoplasmatales archaeon]